MSFVDVRNPVGNCRLKLAGFFLKNTVLVMYLKIEEATNKVFRNLKARKKLQMKHFKVKMTGVFA